MQQGLFTGFKASLYRETQDGRSVTSRRIPPLFRRRWYFVDAAQREAFETRSVRAQILGMIVVVVGVQFVVNHFSYYMLLLAGLVLVLMPALQGWTTSGLSVADLNESPLAPSSRSQQALTQSRAYGERTLWGFLGLGILLTIPQVVVAITEGLWWAWMGAVMFVSMTVYIARLIAQLRAEGVVQQAI